MKAIEQNQNNPSTEKPRYYATDFPELLENIDEKFRHLYLDYQQQGGDKDNGDCSQTSQSGGEPVTLKKLQDLTETAITLTKKGGAINARVTCPSCGSSRCFVKRTNGMWHCWKCGASGCLEEMRSKLKGSDGNANGHYYADARKRQQEQHKAKDYVPMTTDDYEEIDLATRSWLYPIYPFDNAEEQEHFLQHFHPDANSTSSQAQQWASFAARNPDARPLLTPAELASLQGYAQRYLTEMHITPEAARKAKLMCAWMKQKADDQKSEDPHGVQLVPAIAYCNYLDGRIINVKFRSIQPDPITGEWSKQFFQVSPTKPCAPYGIDSINPLRPDAEHIQRLIITEGEKDRLTLLSCGFPYVLSIANGANTDIEESHEAFETWILQAQEIVVCGDSDRPGRGLVGQLIARYQARAKVAVLPRGKKDISEAYAAFGAEEVRRIILEAQLVGEADIFDLADNTDNILDILMGNYDHGYDVGMGEKTDRIFHPTSEGGLIILTGIPTSGKTDFLNCLMAHLMYHCQKRVAFFSFEKPIKGKHVREIARIALGVENTENMDGTETPESAREVNRQALNYLSRHMIDFDTKTRLPDSDYIIAMAEGVMLKKQQPLDYLVIDPYVFINMTEGGSRATETEKVRLMLTKLQAWSRTRHIWTVVVAHPRIQNKEGSQDFPDLNIYSIAGSAQWANLADFLMTVRRVNKPEEGKQYSIVEMLKVRDQEFCQPGKVMYVRQPCGRYDERESEADCIAEAMMGKVLPKDENPW